MKCNDKKEMAREGIEKTVSFFKEIGMPVNLKDIGLENVSNEELMDMALDATMGGTVKLAKVREIDLNGAYEILISAK